MQFSMAASSNMVLLFGAICIFLLEPISSQSQYDRTKTIYLKPSTVATASGIAMTTGISTQVISDKWNIAVKTQQGSDMHLSLDSQWGFHPLYPSTISFTIDGNTSLSSFQDDGDILFVFSVNDRHFSEIVSVDQRRSAYKQCPISNSQLIIRDVTEMITSLQPQRYYRFCQNAANTQSATDHWINHMPQYKEPGQWPMTLYITNDPILNTTSYAWTDDIATNPAKLSSQYITSFAPNAGFDLFISGDNLNENFFVFSINVTYQYTLPPTPEPTANPTISTTNPSMFPSVPPTTAEPTTNPTKSPTIIPTLSPTPPPSTNPTLSPTHNPTATPSLNPTTRQPTHIPTISPTLNPSTQPTLQPTNATRHPTNYPTVNPTAAPSLNPSKEPTLQPTKATNHPTNNPTNTPTKNPTISPTTAQPSTNPTLHPSTNPTVSPTNLPTRTPTFLPSVTPTKNPTISPTNNPTAVPSTNPSRAPTVKPSPMPTDAPIIPGSPTVFPTVSTLTPTHIPSQNPSRSPSSNPTATPSSNPTIRPTFYPTVSPTEKPTANPSYKPTVAPSDDPSPDPSFTPSISPTESPSDPPTWFDTMKPTQRPTADPTTLPTHSPTIDPSDEPTKKPITLDVDFDISSTDSDVRILYTSITEEAVAITMPAVVLIFMGSASLCVVLMVSLRNLCKPQEMDKKMSTHTKSIADDASVSDAVQSQHKHEVYTVHLNAGALSDTESVDGYNIKHIYHVHPRPGKKLSLSERMNRSRFHVFRRGTVESDKQSTESMISEDAATSENILNTTSTSSAHTVSESADDKMVRLPLDDRDSMTKFIQLVTDKRKNKRYFITEDDIGDDVIFD